ncbi:molybdenum cofactor guanylyltransferase MobA [Pseudooceanicola onchidii]|uniref:molybdenum cofactor guanylyltransferase MobA n=1 Tax=Pseudooceanicola onchidii TaxID=2562279 RepID=UPI0010AAE9D6|nr:molybdenum cofactor guanylyltransferase MobA [Pseudooceanicola onchidii]
MRPPPVMILAGGASRRMGGGDKGLRMLAGRPLVAHVIDRIAPQCDDLAINTNGAAADFAGFGLPLLPDVIPDRPGPLAGVLTAMDWALQGGHTHVATVPGDTPFLPGDLIPQLMLAAEASATTPVLAQSGGRVHPVAGLWPVALRDALAQALATGTRRMTDWTAQAGATAVPFPDTTPDAFFNVNTPEDLATAEAAIG